MSTSIPTVAAVAGGVVPPVVARVPAQRGQGKIAALQQQIAASSVPPAQTKSAAPKAGKVNVSPSVAAMVMGSARPISAAPAGAQSANHVTKRVFPKAAHQAAVVPAAPQAPAPALELPQVPGAPLPQNPVLAVVKPVASPAATKVELAARVTPLAQNVAEAAKKQATKKDWITIALTIALAVALVALTATGTLFAIGIIGVGITAVVSLFFACTLAITTMVATFELQRRNKLLQQQQAQQQPQQPKVVEVAPTSQPQVPGASVPAAPQAPAAPSAPGCSDGFKAWSKPKSATPPGGLAPVANPPKAAGTLSSIQANDLKAGFAKLRKTATKAAVV